MSVEDRVVGQGSEADEVLDRPVRRWRGDAVAVPVSIAAATALPIVLLIGWTVADAVQPRSYSPLRQTVSVLAGHAGAHAWIMTSALAVMGCGYLVLALVFDRVRMVARVGLALAGAAAIGLAANPVSPGGADMQHDIWAILGAATLTVWPLLTTRRRASAWVERPAVAIGVTAGFVALSAWLVVEAAGGGLLGAAERIATTAQVCWPAVRVWSTRGRG